MPIPDFGSILNLGGGAVQELHSYIFTEFE
jgi:hypothetical protein